MNKDQDWKNLGDQIMDSVQDALNTGDFKVLNDLVSGTVSDAVEEAKKQADSERAKREESFRRYREQNAINQEKWAKQQEELNRRQQERREEWRKMREAQLSRRQAERENAIRLQQEQMAARAQAAESRLVAAAQQQRPPRPPRPVVAKFNSVGSVSSVLNTIFGSLGLGIGIALLTVAAVFTVLAEGAGIGFAILGGVAFLISTIMLGKGGAQRRLLKRAQRYIQLCGPKFYANIDELARQTGQTVRFVKKDIKRMMRKGMFPEGHLDKDETCFMLSDEVYRQYTETAAAYRMREEMEEERKARENRPLTQEEQEEELRRQQENELNAMMSEGMEYLRRLSELNDAIPGEEVSTQLYRLESLLKQIFDRVKEHPDQMHRMHKLMEYYLPTTVKLVEAYVQFEKVETPGRDIKGAKAEIVKTLGIINEAFTELLNNLFQEDVFDATTDAQVLQTMLSREGLRREMQEQPFGIQEEDDQMEEESPFQLTMEPEQPDVQPALKAPWES